MEELRKEMYCIEHFQRIAMIQTQCNDTDTFFSTNLQLIMWPFLIIYCGALHQNNPGAILKLQDINGC